MTGPLRLEPQEQAKAQMEIQAAREQLQSEMQILEKQQNGEAKRPSAVRTLPRALGVCHIGSLRLKIDLMDI